MSDADALPHAPLEEGRLLYIGNIPLNVQRSNVLKFLQAKGYGGIIIYWSPGDSQTRPAEWQHFGYCIVEFPSKELACKAKDRIPSLKFNGQLLHVSAVKKRQIAAPEPAQPTSTKAPESVAPGSQAKPSHPPANPVTNIPIAASQETITVGREVAEDEEDVDPARMKEVLESFQYPEEYRYTELGGKSKVEQAAIARMADRQNELGTSLLVTYQNPEREVKVRCQAIPTPMSSNEVDRSKTWIFVVSPKGPHITKRIALDQLPEMEAQAWKEFHLPPIKADEGTDHDRRDIPMLLDVYTTDDPARDTIRIFHTGIAISELADGTHWTPEQLVSCKDETTTMISTSTTFIGRKDLAGGFMSATSMGHHVKYSRPTHAGPGWGDYDEYDIWQRCGRKVTADMVPDTRWRTTLGKTVQFSVVENGTLRPGDSVSTANKQFEDNLGGLRALPMRLRERVLKSEGRNVDREDRV
ncbi:uncharacterized protein B0J16DRAFT_384252 [Fusarium flagelliforme]|uniref:uncharacterized protein n=1 Tax=Fusarium flagelliforme TaxID=2675880 RepID=UPI001E8E3FE8|nr:uncharacterized protein B0J16DRAFT_384252 [Fusarium flagelliforme]KAH7185193.1 hypothetical protein B0J16DRAFT_384252 [Fusarium flagelliforme]